MSAEPRLPSAAPSDPEPVFPSERGSAGVGASVDVELPSARTASNVGGIGSTAPPTTSSELVPRPRPPTEPAHDAGSRADRIRLATARGVLGGSVPPQYDAEDWATVLSDNPFEVLYLDYRQPGTIGPAVLDDRRDTLRTFWTQKNDLRSRGAGTQRDVIERKYGGSAVAQYAGRVERAYRRLVDPVDRAREARALDDARRRDGEGRLRSVIRSCLADGLLTVEETETLLQEGEAVGLARDETADYLVRVLGEREFAPRDAGRSNAGRSNAGRSNAGRSNAGRGDVPSAALLSTEWVSAERRTREDAVAARTAERARARAVTPLKFQHGAAHSLEELLDLCDRYPDEAAGYLADGVLEPWLAGAAGEAAAASTAKRVRSPFPAMRRHALELFARALAGPLGLPTAPVLTAHPPECVFGPMPQGARRSLRVEFTREGRPFVWGTARVEHEGRGITVSRTFEDDATGRPPSVEVTVDTVDIPPGEYGTTVRVEPAGGAAVAVPVRFAVLPLALTVDRPALDLGAVPLGGKKGGAVRLAASPNGGRLVGTATLAEPRPGITLTGGVGEEGGVAQLTVDSRLTGPGVQYRSEIRFETNAGVVRVPVSFRVRRAGTEAGIWAGGLAVAGGAGMWFARELLVPGTGWHLSYTWASHAPSVVLAGVTLGVVGRVCAAVLRRVRR